MVRRHDYQGVGEAAGRTGRRQRRATTIRMPACRSPLSDQPRPCLVDATGHTSGEVTGFGAKDVEFLPAGVWLTLEKKRAFSGQWLRKVLRRGAAAQLAPGRCRSRCPTA